DAGRLDRLVRRAGAVVGMELDCLTSVAEKRTLSRLLTILDNDHHPLHSTLNGRQAEKVLCPQGNTTLQRHAEGEGEGEGDGLLCMSLPQSPLLFSALNFSIPLSIFLSFYSFTGYTSPLHRLYYLYHFALSSHTQALNPCTIHTSTRTLSLCTLCTTFLVNINTDTTNFCTL